MSKRTLYHVTAYANVSSIMHNGLSPEFATGKKKVVYVVDHIRLLWAIAHMSARHGKRVDDLLYYRVTLDVKSLCQTQWQGIFTVNHVIRIGLQHGPYSAKVYVLNLRTKALKEDIDCDQPT